MTARPISLFVGSIIFLPSALPANVGGPRPAVTGALDVESQPLAFPDAVWIDARRLQRADVEKYIRTAGVVCDETVATLSIPHFQGSGGHLFSLRLQAGALRRNSRTRS